MEYRTFNDYELLSYVQESNEEASEILFKKYEPFIVTLASKMYTHCNGTGLEINDLIQEGMLGLNHAMRTYSDQKETLFYTYATTCIKRKMISLMVTARRLKHQILNESFSLEISDQNGNYIDLEPILSDSSQNPELLILNSERERLLMEHMAKVLTDFEYQVFELKIHDFQYKEIADLLEKDPKSIDNAIQRIKHKVKDYLKKIE